jgi:hypothetical protein
VRLVKVRWAPCRPVVIDARWDDLIDPVELGVIEGQVGTGENPLQLVERSRSDDHRADPPGEIEAHLSEAIPVGASDDEALEVLERLGPPGDIVDAEQPRVATSVDRRSWREWAAVILLPLGGLALGVGWLIGLILLWSSRLWTTRDKLIGTLIVPGGIATAPWVLVLTGTSTISRMCHGRAAQINPATGAVIRPASIHCVRRSTWPAEPAATPRTTVRELSVALETDP